MTKKNDDLVQYLKSDSAELTFQRMLSGYVIAFAREGATVEDFKGHAFAKGFAAILRRGIEMQTMSDKKYQAELNKLNTEHTIDDVLATEGIEYPKPWKVKNPTPAKIAKVTKNAIANGPNRIPPRELPPTAQQRFERMSIGNVTALKTGHSAPQSPPPGQGQAKALSAPPAPAATPPSPPQIGRPPSRTAQFTVMAQSRSDNEQQYWNVTLRDDMDRKVLLRFALNAAPETQAQWGKLMMHFVQRLGMTGHETDPNAILRRTIDIPVGRLNGKRSNTFAGLASVGAVLEA
ncbi:hypothetical protein [Celeribacter sp. PS-C1]|uniref:hypothetical protein n=1 Tax=Celeribacter sp. PS-C1 TaxID=2820813 RepID=UPI001CA58F9B|nr:hypothetical protein [Celeribacter sp. PS-C1]MBW6419508.1 hypothetical protein [Celeribacter sp. PS-C1]